MARFIYAPDHPEANHNGFIPAEIYYAWKNGHVHTRDVPYIISDTMDGTRHMADGRMYDSKQKFRAATKAAGCIEVGNETPTLLKPRKPVEPDRRTRRNDIKRAVWELNNGRKA